MDSASAADAPPAGEVTVAPAASPFGVRADRWQERFYVPIKVAGCLAIAAFVFHVVDFHHVLHTLSLTCAWTSWSIFTVEVAVMLTVSRSPSAWARGHRLDIAVLAFACPLWPHLFSDLYLSELLPTFTLFDATVLAKLAKGVRALRRHGAAADRRAPAPAEGRSPAVAPAGTAHVGNRAAVIADASTACAAATGVPVGGVAAPADGASGGGAKAGPTAPSLPAAEGSSDRGASGAAGPDDPPRQPRATARRSGP